MGFKDKIEYLHGECTQNLYSSFGNETFKNATPFLLTQSTKYLAKYYSSTVLICVCDSSSDREETKEQRNTVPSLFEYPSIQDSMQAYQLITIAAFLSREASKTILEKTGKHT